MYNKDNLYSEAKEIAKNNSVYFIEDIVGLLPCSKTTFYEYFPVDSDELNDLKEILERNKIKTKAEIRGKLLRSEKAGELLALYKLIGTPEERKALSQSYTEPTGKDVETVHGQTIKYGDIEIPI